MRDKHFVKARPKGRSLGARYMQSGNDMATGFKASRDIIIRTDNWSEALQFYGSVLNLPATEQGDAIVGFETGSFCLYVEQGKEHGPVFEFLVPNVQAAKRKLIAAGCSVIEEDPGIPRCYIRDPYGMVFNVGLASHEKGGASS